MQILDLQQPKSVEAEQELLGAILINNRAHTKVAPFLRAEHFHHDAHRRIFEIASEMIRRGEVANPVTLKPFIDRDPVIGQAGGLAYLARLAGSATTVINAEHYGRAIVNTAQGRRLIGDMLELAQRAEESGINEPPSVLIAEGMARLQQLAADTPTDALTNVQVAEQLAIDLDKDLPCYSTGLPDWDHSLGGGFYAGKCYGLAARKKVGKTTLAATVSYNLNIAGVPHAYIACEASPKEIMEKLVARYFGFNSMAFLDRDRTNLAAKTIQYAREAPANIYFEHAPGVRFDDLQRRVANLILRHGVKGFVLDYLQLVTGKGARETEEYHHRQVAQWLADICRKHGVWALVLAQLNQDGNIRGGEGLKLACDQSYTLNREKDEIQAWMAMDESRYTRYRNVGSDVTPALRLNNKGPHYEDFSLPVQGDMYD